MAEPIVRKFVIDTAESEQNLKELNTQIQATSSAVEGGAQSLNDVAAAEENVTVSSKSLKAQLRELQAQLANVDPQSEKYAELSKQAGILKDKIQDAAQAVGSQAGSAFEKVGGSLGLVTSRISNLDFEGAAEGAKLLAKNITEVKPGDIANGIKSIGSAFASVGKALLTNPIFLIGAAIAAAVVYSEELLSLIDGVSSAEQERLAAQKESATLAKQQLDAISEQENILRLQGKTEKEILQLKIIAGKEAILQQKAVIETLKLQKQQQIEAAERNKAILKGLLNFVSLPLTAILSAVDLLTSTLNKAGLLSDETFGKIGNLRDKFTTSVAELVFNPADVAKEGDAAIAEAEKTLKGLENQQAGFQLSINQINKKAADDRKTAAEKEAADIKAIKDKEVADELARIDAVNAARKKANEDRIAQEDAQFALLQELTLSQQQKEIQAAVKLAEDRLKIAGDDANLQKLIAEAREKDIADIIAKYNKENTDTVVAGTETVVQTNLDKVKAALEWAEKGLNALSSLTDAVFAIRANKVKKGSAEEEALAKKQFRINKALQLAGATIDASKAITASLSASPVAIGPVPNPAGIASLALATTTGIANIAKIASTKFEGGGSPPTSTTPSIGGGGTEGTQPAQFNPFANINVEGRPNQPTPRAYVLAGDVASQQEVRQKVEDLSRIG